MHIFTTPPLPALGLPVTLNTGEQEGWGGAGLFWLLAPPEQMSGISVKEGKAEEAGN